MEGPLSVALLAQLADSALPLTFILAALLLLGPVLRAQPSRRTLALIFLPVPLLTLTIWLPGLNRLFDFYTPLLALAMLTDAFLLTPPTRLVSLRRTVNRRLYIGQRASVMLTVINNSEYPLVAEVRDDLPSGLSGGILPDSPESRKLTLRLELPPLSFQDAGYEIQPSERGQYRFGRIYMRYRSRLGLLWMTTRGGRAEEVRVVPDLRKLRRLRLKAARTISAGETHRRALGLEGTLFSGLRPYFAGDDIRKMAWQATARLERPVVRTFEPETAQPILLLMDAGRRMRTRTNGLSRYDRALNAALAFAGVAIDRNDRVGAAIFAREMLAWLPVQAGPSHFNTLLDALSETEPRAEEPDYPAILNRVARSLKRRTLVVLFTDFSDPSASQRLLESLSQFSPTHLLLVVTFSDTRLSAMAQALPETAEDAYRQGVALDVLEERRRALSLLSRSRHIAVIEAPPEKLDDALIARYFDLKRRNRF